MIQSVICECNQQDGANFVCLEDADNLNTREALLCHQQPSACSQGSYLTFPVPGGLQWNIIIRKRLKWKHMNALPLYQRYFSC